MPNKVESERKTIKRTIFISITSFNIFNTVRHYSYPYCRDETHA